MQRNTIAALLAGLFSVAAQAGECPADKKVADGQGQKMVAHGPKDVTDMVIASTDLSKEKMPIPDRLFRARRLEVKPGGIVPWHSHGERPAMIHLVSGEMTEYASTCAVPIVHKPGETTAERAPTSHWWKNTGKRSAVLISVDIFPVAMKSEEKTM